MRIARLDQLVGWRSLHGHQKTFRTTELPLGQEWEVIGMSAVEYIPLGWRAFIGWLGSAQGVDKRNRNGFG